MPAFKPLPGFTALPGFIAHKKKDAPEFLPRRLCLYGYEFYFAFLFLSR
jgi:hypothetical protein